MAKIFYLHWNQAEAEAFAATLTAAGHEVVCHWSTEEPAKWGDYVPDAVVISLDRLPSHGREVAEWIWEVKKRQSIPIIFAGGKPDKVKAAREQFPKAVFCPADEVTSILEKIT